MKITYKFTTKFDLSPKYHEFSEDMNAKKLINYLNGFKQLCNPNESNAKIELDLAKYHRRNVIVDEIYFNNKLVWHYRNGFTND